ncbi:MAG TPA: primosomal protein N' [Chloroflexota bacterium]|nr:primosomal protein N' [Chloroflexota bacterium]
MGDGLKRTSGYAEVALQARAARVGRLLTYAVPDGWAVQPGQLVWAPLQGRTVLGVVTRVGQAPPPFTTRPLLAVLSEAPVVAAWQLQLALWLADRYACSVAEALAGFLPPDARRPRLLLAEGAAAALAARPGGEALLRAFRRHRGGVPLSTAVRAIAAPALAELLAAGLVRPAPVLSLATTPLPPVALPPPASRLTPAQHAAYTAIRQALETRESASFLLHGITGSGKTHVYLHAMRDVLARGQQAVLLVSDISLVPAAERRLAEWFPGLVAVLHSERTPEEQRTAWRRIASGEARVVLGARSALFAPLRDVGLVIVDEEHEAAYKQSDLSPCYHAREVALKLGELNRAVVVLGSATPDVCTYQQAQQGKHRLLVLPQRYEPLRPAREAGVAPAGRLPTVQIVDLRAELAAGNTGIFSRALLAELARTLDLGNQAILFLNRRGTATCVTCRDCGHTVACADCLLPMIYHGDLDALLCHHCNRRRRPPASCPGCRSRRIRYLGAGTQRVAEEVRRHFPGARLLRWDRDTAAQGGAHARLWETFARGEADVLVGTQMVAKGLDFPRVTLVGVVLADTSLYLPDYRASERAFQLLMQVAGRAGRGEQPGRVIVQTYSPQHYAIQAARQHDYRLFFERELAFRREHAYPPFRRLARLLYTDPDETRCWRECGRVLRLLRAQLAAQGLTGVQLFGPAPAFLRRLRGRYRWQILISAPAPERLLAACPLRAGWTVDVDPASLL